MAEDKERGSRGGPFRRLAGDIPQALAVGSERDPLVSVSGGRWVLGLAVASALAGIGLFLTGGYHAGFAWLNGLATTLPGWVWQWLTVLGDERVAFALSLIFARSHPRVFWTLICAALIAVAYSRGLKPLVDAARPPLVLEPGSFQLIGPGHRRESFPSGHSVTAAVFFGALIYYARGVRWRLLLSLFLVLVGLSRVAVGVHWPVDVAAGLAGGLLAVLIGLRLARRMAWGSLDPGVHLAFVTAAVIVSLGLFVDDGGYPAATPLLWSVAALGLASAVLGYVIRPVLAALRGRA